MKRKYILTGLIAVVVAIIFIYSFSGGQSDEDYITNLVEERQETDRFMNTSDESPFKGLNEGRVTLNYYPPDPAYKINARFTPRDNPEVITLATSDGKQKEYLSYGTAEFVINKRKQQLIILENPEERSLFLAFGDSTSAHETYGGGRYIDITHSGGRTIPIDFNRAYNPYCAYNATYSCPLPLKSNLLDIPVYAGEKMY